jgi:uncharacterized protein
MPVLIDTNILLALAFPKDPNHVKARSAMRELTDERIVAAPVLPELFYMVSDRMDYASAISAFNLARSRVYRIEALIADDMARMSQIMTEYQDSKFDFVDVSIMALSERLNVTHVYTLDRRDFMIFRPKHCSYLTLVP